MEGIGLPGTVQDVERYLSTTVELEPSPGDDVPLRQISRELLALGLAPGEPVLIALANGKPLLRRFFAVLAAGGVPTILPPAVPSARLHQIAGHLGARTVLVPRTQAAAHRPVARRPVGTTEALLLSGDPGRRYEPGDVIILTSGTSGVFSGCRHRLSSLVRNARRHAAAIGLRSGDTMLVNLPLNFSYALVAQLLAGLVTDTRLVVTGPPFTPAAYTAAVTEHQVTCSSLTPHMVRTLLGSPWKPPETLRLLTVGGDALEPDVTAQLLDRAPGMELYLTYGLTEAGPRVSTLAAHREPPHRYGSVGRPLAGVEVSLRAPDEHGVGELQVTSDTVLREKVGSTDTRNGSRLVAPGVIATGDLFRLDAEGYLYFQGRLSDIAVLKGNKVSLASIRRIANTLPGVAGSATSTYRAEDGETRLNLDLYLHDLAPGEVARTKRALLGQLLRFERPDRITVRPATERGPK
ncbi:class I adenylate-forming enzyme family protein [Micromonospora cathayae]|uniref:Class I adenylate-forming enzyme family protein n=1 Tax=Micromonospora cathayae TaxID=3028804 RepID=A0ABY7ZLH6_9ACTN|nr:class I adenylate-forming enzyme family protein [Micromonospora sp. HUAS 3]WDZ83826.1 class I adenylate-forming enzyme family protein [Micromonospora sp. HUAS 3]